MKADNLSVTVSAKLTITDETADRCLRLLEMWLADNSNYAIIGETDKQGTVRLKRIMLDEPTTGN